MSSGANNVDLDIVYFWPKSPRIRAIFGDSLGIWIILLLNHPMPCPYPAPIATVPPDTLLPLFTLAHHGDRQIH